MGGKVIWKRNWKQKYFVIENGGGGWLDLRVNEFNPNKFILKLYNVELIGRRVEYRKFRLKYGKVCSLKEKYRMSED